MTIAQNIATRQDNPDNRFLNILNAHQAHQRWKRMGRMAGKTKMFLNAITYENQGYGAPYNAEFLYNLGKEYGHTPEGKSFNRTSTTNYFISNFTGSTTIVPITTNRLYYYMYGLQENPILGVNFGILKDQTTPNTFTKQQLCEKFSSYGHILFL